MVLFLWRTLINTVVKRWARGFKLDGKGNEGGEGKEIKGHSMRVKNTHR